jgi:sporulation related protein
VVRVPRAGGMPRAFAYTVLDSAIWNGQSRAPAISRVLGFDDEAGTLAVVDARGAPRRIELRTGTVTPPPSLKLTALTSANGAALYGVSATGAVTRLTPTDATPWTFRPPSPARDVAPQLDGTVLIVGTGPDATTVWRIHPPETQLLDSARLPHGEHMVHAEIGDRVYFTGDSAVRGVRARDLQATAPVQFPHRVRAVVPTPSGDRLYVALDSTPALRIIDRYSGRSDATVSLPGNPTDLRMDPLGRYLLVRPASGDSAWVVTIGADRVVGSVRTGWTVDLPFVGPDGTIAVAERSDVVFVDGSSLRQRRTVPGGARDFWIPLRWNGFRARPSTLAEPVAVTQSAAPDSSDSIGTLIRRARDSAALAMRVPAESMHVAPRAIADSSHGALAVRVPPATSSASHQPGFTVQFAAVLNPDTARVTARHISANGAAPHVIATSRGGVTVYRVILGPYTTRTQADAVGRSARHQYWVYEGTP